ncbi:Guanine nucleotide-binding protein G(O) subunit alpha, variant 2 [Balamuthia mandrillaris]
MKRRTSSGLYTPTLWTPFLTLSKERKSLALRSTATIRYVCPLCLLCFSLASRCTRLSLLLLARFRSSLFPPISISSHLPISAGPSLPSPMICFRGAMKEVATDLYEQYRVNKDVEPETIEVDNVMTPVFAIDQALGKVIKTLWEDPGIRQTYNQRSQLKFHLGDSVAYYLDEVERTSDPKYVPDEIDILRARVKTTSVVETTFEWEGAAFRLVDVGGQKGERKKWLPLFSGVTAILFCVAMNEYDVMMEEDPTTNRMHDALQLWHDVVNNHHLINVPIILFLNKKDLFESKIQKKDLKVCFPNYKGGKDYDKASTYIRDKFLREVPRGKVVKAHFTQATDTKNIQIVWNSLREIFISKVMEEIV